MSPSLFPHCISHRLQLNSQSWIQVHETAGRKVLYLKCETPTVLHVEKLTGNTSIT